MDADLSIHGTRLMDIPPRAIAGAAINDIRLRERKKDKLNSLGVVVEEASVSPGAPYAFHRKHVGPAKDAADVIARALAERKLGETCAKSNTRLIYESEEKLRAALEIARQRVAAT